MLQSTGERRELAVDAELVRLRENLPPRSHTVAVISPKGGVGKTTSTFVLGSALCTQLGLTAVAVDANPDYGTLGALAPDRLRVAPTLAELLAELERVTARSQLRRYVAHMPSGLDLLAAPVHPEVMAQLTPDLYGQLLAFLARYYDVVLLDCGTGVADPVAQFAVERADQVLVVATPEWVTADVVTRALDQLPRERATLVLNKSTPDGADAAAVERHFRTRTAHQVRLPFDPELATMLDSATYTLERLRRRTRLPVKRLALAVAQGLA